MFQLINEILLEFRKEFKRIKTWQWFVILTAAFMIRHNYRGVTSVISTLRLKPKLYHAMLHFFRSSAYSVEGLYGRWIKTAAKHGTFTRIEGRIVALGDHINISKEGLHMPGIEILHQESDNSGKPKFISGHKFGQVSAVMTNGQTSRSLPLMTEMQTSPPWIKIKGKKVAQGDTTVTQMVKLIDKTAQFLGEPVVAALDAYFSSEAAWAVADRAITEVGERRVEIVTRGQTNTVGYTIPEPPEVRRPGQPRVYGDRVVLYNLFADAHKDRFTHTTMTMYGKETNVRYLCIDLIWKPVKKLVRFVAVETDSGFCVLMSSDLTLHPESIITIYSLRFKIETSFDEQKNDMGVFDYHFWTEAQPKRKRKKKAEPPPSCDANQQKKIDDTKKAIESHVCLCIIATGILTVIAFTHNREIWKRYPGWIRTLRSPVPTIATVKETLVHEIPLYLSLFPHVPFCSIINFRRRHEEFIYEDVFDEAG